MVNEWIGKTVRVLGKLDGSVNMTGICTFATIAEETDEMWDLNMNVNAKGVFNCVRAQIRSMQDGGSIVSTSSICGLQGFATNGSYCASKHAVIGLTRAAAKENPRIRLNCVAPGVINTPMTQAEAYPDVNDEVKLQIIKRPGKPEEVAKVVNSFWAMIPAL
ncbi:hypothetical protein BHE90_003666 [Fusarium euwallaceae]|uniref:3-oxoacyl-[acyl-carrier-protein] reductase FabG n=2 Tax=Fusarium solani species complex TaxID=232080 RepID=A0A3M2RYG5_9HYPO|nr:hypothetical protein CDV36_010029 [Fusarium kuroshium]RTE81759.1 hypothetical protein BHE90_003666 [Fusarium euwallaceae]